MTEVFLSAVALLFSQAPLTAQSMQDQRKEWLFRQTDPVTSLGFSPDGELLAVGGSSKGEVILWDLSSGDKKKLMDRRLRKVSSVAFSSDGRSIVAAGSGPIILWEMKSLDKTIIPNNAGVVMALAFHPRASVIALGELDGKVQLRSILTGEGSVLVDKQHNCVKRILFSASGDKLVSILGGDNPNTVTMWNMKQVGRPVVMMVKKAKGVRSLAFSANGSVLAMGIEKDIVLYDCIVGRERGRLRGHSDAVSALAFSPDGQWLASAGPVTTKSLRQNEIKIWHLESRQSVLAHRWADGKIPLVISMAFSPDGKRLACGNWDSTVRVWTLAALLPSGKRRQEP